MNPSLRAQLTSDLSGHVATIAAELREQLLAPGPVRTAGEALHVEEKVGDDYDVWTDLLSRRAAVLFVLKTVYVRVLEDRGAIQPVRLVDVGSQRLFEQLAPNLGETAYLRWVFRDLASEMGGLPELFAPQPAELGTPSDEASRELLRLWRRTDPDTGELVYRFDCERFDGALMGDLYQELDPVVKERYALLQTPDFVRDFILDKTLEPAIAEWGASTVRLLDPACGSGHFLLEGFRRLVKATAAEQPEWSQRKVVRHALDRVVGIDLNDYACALARARLVMLALELSGSGDIRDAADFEPQVYWADGLEQVERDEEPARQGDLLTGSFEPHRASLTRPEVRRVLRGVLAGGFHAVVANPPYITEKDPARKDYHREKLGRDRRFVSAAGKYSLSSPFTERCFQLAVPEGFVGLITSDAFMNRSFGKALIEKVLTGLDLTLVVNSAGAYIPGHGTTTVIFFARKRPPQGATVRAVMGKRGEPTTPDVPAEGSVWTSILAAAPKAGFENEFISSADLPREVLDEHPWSLQGGGATALQSRIEKRASSRLGDSAESIGFASFPGTDDAFVLPLSTMKAIGVPKQFRKVFVAGETVRNWTVQPRIHAVAAYDEHAEPVTEEGQLGEASRHFWRLRTKVLATVSFGGVTRREAGDLPWLWYRWQADRYRTPLTITFAFVATHNHFAVDRGGKVFNRSAPVIKLPPDATEDDHLALLGLLNSSIGCFWLKQVCFNKGRGGNRVMGEEWEQAYELDSTNIRKFPLFSDDKRVLTIAKALDRLGTEATLDRVEPLLDEADRSATLKALLLGRRQRQDARFYRMVALQEKLDWTAYFLLNLVPEALIGNEDHLVPGTRAFEVVLARRKTDRRVQQVSGQTTGWFDRHGWPIPSTDPMSALAAARVRAIEEDRFLGIVEHPIYKRRWYKPDYDAEEQDALRTWLTDRIEGVFARHDAPRNPRQVATVLQSEPRVLAAAEVYTGRPDYDLEVLVAELVKAESVPNHPLHLYKPKGLVKRKAWEKTWADQRREDAGEDVTPDVPPKYTGGDFLRSEHYKLRGKLDVPKERFIALTEVPGTEEPLYGWAGWTPAQRFRAWLDLDEELDDQGVAVADRLGLLDSAWRLLPDVEREDPAVYRRGRAELVAILGEGGPSQDALDRWFEDHPPPHKRRSRRRR